MLQKGVFDAHLQGHGRHGSETTGTGQADLNLTFGGDIHPFPITTIGLQCRADSLENSLDFLLHEFLFLPFIPWKIGCRPGSRDKPRSMKQTEQFVDLQQIGDLPHQQSSDAPLCRWQQVDVLAVADKQKAIRWATDIVKDLLQGFAVRFG